MEREAGEEALFRRGLRSLRGLVELGQATHHSDHVRAECTRVPDIVRLEEPAAQHFGHVFLLNRLHPFLALAQEDIEEIGNELLAHIAPLLARIGGEQGGHDRGPVDPDYGLGEGLEEVHDSIAPHRTHPGLLAGVHQHLVHQDEGREAACAGLLDELHEKRFGGRCLALLGQSFGVNRAKPVRSGELEGQRAPGVTQSTSVAVRPTHPLDAPLDIDLVEAECDRERAREIGADMLPEFAHRRQIRQCRRVAEEVVEGDEGMGLAAAVGELQLPHRLVALSREPRRDVLHELPQRKGRKGEREELLRVLVHRAAALRECHLVEVGRELREGEFAGAEFVFQADDMVPGLGLTRLH